jgi:hypothetical protein
MLCAGNTSAVEEWTTSNKIKYLSINTGVHGYAYYIHVPTGWGAPSCPGATYVTFPADAQGAKELLALAMLARTLNAYINVLGECQGPSLFLGKVIQLIDH